MQQPTEQFDLQQKLAVLRRSRSMLVLFCISAMVSSLILTYIYSERYRAVTTITYRPTQAIRFQSREAQSLGFPVPLLPFEAIGQTISQIGTSEVILRQVVERLGLDQPDTKARTGFAYVYHETKKAVKKFGRRTWQIFKYGRFIEEDLTSAAIIHLAKDVTIDTSRKDFTATVTVVDKYPERAATIVDVLGEVLVDFMREENSRFARTQRQELDRMLIAKQQEIDDVRRQIENLKSRHGFISLRKETNLNLESIEEFERKLRLTHEDLGEAQAKLAQIRTQRQSQSMMIKVSESRTDDPLYDELREMKADREVARQGLLQKLPADHLDVQAINAELAATERALASAQAKRVTDETTHINEIYQKTLAEELETQARVAGLEAARKSLQETLAELRKRLRDPSVESKLNGLTQKLEVLESTYQQLATAQAESRVAELESEGEIHILHKATPQDAPFRPIKIYHVLLSGMLALILGVGVVYLLDFWQSLLGRPDGRGSMATGERIYG